MDAVSYRLRDQVIERGGLLYNLSENSFHFEGPTELIITTHLPFESIPEDARNYITKRASRILIENRVGDPSMIQFSQRLEAESLVILQEMEASNGDYSAFRNSTVASLYRNRGL